MARNPADFWRRWNISLSTWFRDYVYIPLGGSREGNWRWARNVLITFLLSGLWHGASWNYVLWGLYHGLLLVITRARQILKPAARPAHPWLIVPQIAGMFVLTSIGWLLFRETELSAILRDLTLSPFASPELDRQARIDLCSLALLYSLPLWAQSIWVELNRLAPATCDEDGEISVAWPRLLVQGAACGLALAAILVFRSRTSLDFIYFQF